MMIRFIFFCACLLVYAGCKKDKDQGDTAKCGNYTARIKPLVNAKCALSGCHGNGSSLGDFTKYAELKWRADSGRVRKYVFELKIMPPANAVQLTDDEKKNLKCWLDNGAPQD